MSFGQNIQFLRKMTNKMTQEDLSLDEEAYSNIRFEEVEPFHYIKCAVISREPEEDAICHIQRWAQKLDIEFPQIIGWDFPVLSQEQTNVYNMHGYEAALLLEEEASAEELETEVFCQEAQRYIAITIREPSLGPFYLIPNAYKALMTYMKLNGVKEKHDKRIIGCFEKEYIRGGVDYMDVYIAVE